MAKEILPLLLAQALFFTAVLLVFRKRIKPRTALIAIACGLLIPFSFAFGLFFGSFSTNVCYSDALSNVRSTIGMIAASDNAELRKTFSDRLASIPLRGYESDCAEINSATAEVYKAIKSAPHPGANE